MKKFEKLLTQIDKRLQVRALAEINKARVVLGGRPIKAIITKGTDNTLGGHNTPLGKSISNLLTPGHADGSGFKEIDGLYCGVWEVPDKVLGERLAKAWGTVYKRKRMRDYCCHRHFEESAMVTVLPPALQKYESAVVDAYDEATRCDDCGRDWFD